MLAKVTAALVKLPQTWNFDKLLKLGY